MKDPFLLTMVRWNASAKHGWKKETHFQGKAIRSWIEDTTWKELSSCFAHLEAEDLWKALEKTTALFTRLSADTAKLLGYSYSSELAHHLSRFISDLKDREQD